MAKVKSVKVWKNPARTETRIYVKMSDGREGCWYRTGNAWNAKDSKDGNMTAEDWAEARRVSVWDNAWHTVYENEMAGRNCGPDEDVRSDLGALANAPRGRDFHDEELLIAGGI